MKSMVRSKFCLVLGLFAMLALAGNARAQDENAAGGQCGPLFGAKVCTSYLMRAGKITEVTLRVPLAAVEHAPADVPMVWPPKPSLNIPFAPVVEKQTGFTYASIWWEAHGHPPAAFMVPHFDLHFYFAPEQRIETIDCKNGVKPNLLPAGYVMPDLTEPHIGKMIGACIPAMGMHAAPSADVESKSPWKSSMILGYYGGAPIFFEPMVARSFLLQNHSFSLPVPQGIQPVAHVRYPKSFRATYLPKSNAYYFTLFY